VGSVVESACALRYFDSTISISSAAVALLCDVRWNQAVNTDVPYCRLLMLRPWTSRRPRVLLAVALAACLQVRVKVRVEVRVMVAVKVGVRIKLRVKVRVTFVVFIATIAH